MNMLIGAFKLLYWACVGVSMFLMGVITLLIGLFALVGRLSWWLLFEQPKDRSVSAGPQRTQFKD
jgi:hypothetical protein